MNSSENLDEVMGIAQEAIRKFQYSSSLLSHWINSLGLSSTLKLIDGLRKPNNSIWVQVNASKIDFDSLIDIFEERGHSAKKHPSFSDIILVDVEQRKLEGNLDNLPVVKADHESQSGVALGKDIQTADVAFFEEFKTKDKVKILDQGNNIIATGIAEVNSSEIPTLSQRTVVKITSSLAFAPPLAEFRTYRRGYFNILSPIQIIGVKSMDLKSADNILVMSSDKGDVANYIAELTQNKVPITQLARNEMQLKAVRKNIERANNKATRIMHIPFLGFLRERQELKYTTVYVEPQNSRTAIIPVFSSNLTFGRLKKFSLNQKRIITDLFKCLHPKASVTYVTHSIDFIENEEAFGTIMEKAYYELQKFPVEINNLKKQNKLSARNVPERFQDLFNSLDKSSIFLNPVETVNSGGFIAKFAYAKKS